jgi:hypothetical protein
MADISSIIGTYKTLIMYRREFPDIKLEDAIFPWSLIKEEYKYLHEELESLYERQRSSKIEQLTSIISTYRCITKTKYEIRDIFPDIDKLKRELEYLYGIQKDLEKENPPKLDLVDIPSYGDVMEMKEFIQACDMGAFIDYDGSGHLIVGDKMAQNITIVPSDIVHGLYREYEKVIWFNK